MDERIPKLAWIIRIREDLASRINFGTINEGKLTVMIDCSSWGLVDSLRGQAEQEVMNRDFLREKSGLVWDQVLPDPEEKGALICGRSPQSAEPAGRSMRGGESITGKN